MFFASYVIACSLEPVVKKLSNKYSRNTASVIAVVGTLLAICLFVIPIFILTGNEIKDFAHSFPQYITNIKLFILKSSIVSRFSDGIDLNELISSTSPVTTKMFSGTIEFGKHLGSGFVYLIISIMAIYYFLADKERIRKAFLRLFPVHLRDGVQNISHNISQKIGGYVVAQITTMASVGIIVSLGLLLLRNEYALILGLITAVLDIVPIIGPAIALVICVIMTYKYGALMISLVILIFAVAQIAENNFVRPYVFGKFMDLHPLIIYLFLFLAAKYLGAVGVVFAPAIAATCVVLIEEIYIKNLEQ